ncbi:histidine kinase [Chitinophaga pendula]|uniref:sensor histidine kinase n=1 Tax=Chitinophaga TaxID=79328 RepID=UPI000BB00753|nr:MULTISPECIES: histidine kinase [Chitinophaga]ASZ12200.1 histidine kinase [Chitinophaga sp. MD30]UCJ04770.1 histidine kinase [Chitinophaga pendula]
MKNINFRISPIIIWVSSIFLGLLASVPHIAEHRFNTLDALVNSTITCLFSLFVWYYNIYTLPRNSSRKSPGGFSYTKLITSLVIGIFVMFGLAIAQQYILSHLHFGAVMLMVEVRGILINLVFYLLIHLLFQNYKNQQVSLELERTKANNLGAQYELLKQQINPHFLFNSLNTLKAMVETSDKNTVEFILKLADFYRFTLESRKLDLIQVSNEMEIVDAYLFLLKERFEDGFICTNTISPAHLNTLIPPFTLQLLIENCIKHNIVSLERPLHIHLYSEEDAIVIENPVQLKRIEEETSLGVGLKNINLRYVHLLDKQIEIISTKETFKVKLPVIHEYYHH